MELQSLSRSCMCVGNQRDHSQMSVSTSLFNLLMAGLRTVASFATMTPRSIVVIPAPRCSNKDVRQVTTKEFAELMTAVPHHSSRTS